MTESIEAGAAVVDITPGAGVPMGGYGARKGVAQGTRDGLKVRTIVLRDGDTVVAMCICDLVGVGPDIVAKARETIERESGVPAANVLVGATHTHSGPASVRGVDAEGYGTQTARRIAGSVLEAMRAMQTVTLKVAETEVTQVGQNRRHPDGPIESVARVLVAAAPAATPVATVVNYACHPTVLEYDNLLYSPDFAGAAARFVERNVGGVGIYMQGCAGDINPVWMRHDFDEVERVGGILGAAATRAAHELRPLGEGQWAVNLSWSEQTPKQPAPGTVLSGIGLRATTAGVDLPRRVLPPADEIAREIEELQSKLAALDAGDVLSRRALRPRLNELRMQRSRGTAVEPGTTERVELMAIRISSECSVVTLPGEMHVQIGHDIRERAGVRHLFIAGYSNGYIGYLPKASDYAEGGYEVGSTRFAPEAAEILTQAAVDAVRAL